MPDTIVLSGKYYPTGYQDGSAENLLLVEKDIRAYHIPVSNKIHRDGKMAVHFVCTTFNRIAVLYRDWHDGCEVGKLFDYAKIDDQRRVQIEFLRTKLEKFLRDVKCFFIRAPYQHVIRNDWDWAHEWISCGAAGTVTVEGEKVKCLLGFAVVSDDSGMLWEWGARRHPDETETNRPDEWWVATGDGEYIYNSKNECDAETCVHDLEKWIELFHFEVS